MDLNYLMDTLRSNGYKITEQRKAILQVLSDNSSNLVSVEQLLCEAKELNKKTNITTIYRNLEIFEKLDLLYRFVTEYGVALYKLACRESSHHHHIICKSCGKTEVIDFCPIDTFKHLSEDKNFNLTDHKLELYGYCDKCQYKKKVKI